MGHTHNVDDHDLKGLQSTTRKDEVQAQLFSIFFCTLPNPVRKSIKISLDVKQKLFRFLARSVKVRTFSTKINSQPTKKIFFGEGQNLTIFNEIRWFDSIFGRKTCFSNFSRVMLDQVMLDYCPVGPTSFWKKGKVVGPTCLLVQLDNSPTWLGPTWPEKNPKKHVFWPKIESNHLFYLKIVKFWPSPKKKFLVGWLLIFVENVLTLTERARKSKLE